MPQSSTLDCGMEVHQESSAVADVAQDHGAEVTDLSTIGTRPADIDPLYRTLTSQANALVFVDEAGSGGSWR
jgi:hypothetical protein